MIDYYETNRPTSANYKDIVCDSEQEQHFPSEGLFLGNLASGPSDLPALADLNESGGICFLYRDEANRKKVNTCLERLAWRLALTVPSNLCDLVLFNGGYPGEVFNAHIRINRYLFSDRTERVFFDGNLDAFKMMLDETYTSIVSRMSTIRCAGKNNLVELNESLGREAQIKYQFFILADFPRHFREDLATRLAQIVSAGSKAGIFVLMSWDMNAELVDAAQSSAFSVQQMLSNMEVLLPQGGRYVFHNSGHDDLLNRFTFSIDDSPVPAQESEKLLQQIDIQVETAKKMSKPAALKPDLYSLEKNEYESVINEISVTVGKDIFDKHPVSIRFNSKDYIHCFILGQSGSGKSVLLNDIITSAILKYSPGDLMLYLMDFKGVEFNRYKGEKHTKAVLVDNSDLQMALEVLRELKEENRRRIKLWQQECVSNIDGYNKKHLDARLPQILFVADECQVLFKESTKCSERMIMQEISEILNVMATQGRSQGIHMLLATQQLDETDISGQVLKNLTECFLMMSAPSDSDRLVPDSSSLTSKQRVGLACYYHKRELQSQVQTFFANDQELESAISAAQEKAGAFAGNGGHYFCGSSLFYLSEDKSIIDNSTEGCPVSLIGRNIGINAGATTIPLRTDFFEHILVWGANRKEQAVGVLMNAYISLIQSYREQGIDCDFIAIDCMPSVNNRYQKLLAEMSDRGMCRLVERKDSGKVLGGLVNDIKSGLAVPTVLAIIGSDHFIEVKRRMKLASSESVAMPDVAEDDIWDIPDIEMDTDIDIDVADMTYPQALMYLLEEGPMNGIHILMQIDKPSNILFGDEYDVEAANKFRHKVILRSENKFLNPLRFSQDIDVETLSDEEERMRAYYYPDGGDPVLFTPYQMPELQ